MSDREANFKLAVVRSGMLANFYRQRRQENIDPLTANELTNEHAKFLDAKFDRDLEVIRQCMERKS